MKRWREKQRGEKLPMYLENTIIGKVTPNEFEIFMLAAPEPTGKGLSYAKIAKKLHKSHNYIKKTMCLIHKKSPEQYDSLMVVTSHNKTEVLCEKTETSNYVDITEREKQLISMYLPGPIGSGMSVADIAAAFGINNHDVRGYFKRFARRNPEAWKRVKGMRKAMHITNNSMQNPVSLTTVINDEDYDVPATKFYYDIG